MADLITAGEVVGRLGPQFPIIDPTQLAYEITDVSALVVQAVGDTDVTGSWDDTTVPQTIKRVMTSAIRRSLVNPDGFGSETVDAYRYEQAPREGMFLTHGEVEVIRKAAGSTGVFTSVALVSPWSGDPA